MSESHVVGIPLSNDLLTLVCGGMNQPTRPDYRVDPRAMGGVMAAGAATGALGGAAIGGIGAMPGAAGGALMAPCPWPSAMDPLPAPCRWPCAMDRLRCPCCPATAGGSYLIFYPQGAGLGSRRSLPAPNSAGWVMLVDVSVRPD